MNEWSLTVAYGTDLGWAWEALRTQHYLRREPDPRTRPLTYVVRRGPLLVGCLTFGRPQASCCYDGGLTYGSRERLAAGLVRFDRWELLNLSRFWLSPAVQRGGAFCAPEHVPGFLDRRGVWHSNLASLVIRAALARVNADYLVRHPPVFLGHPYAIRAVLSYCDRRRHKGTLYRAAGFRLARTNREGMETWYSEEVAALTSAEDEAIRRASQRSERAARIRAQDAPPPQPSLFSN